MMSSDVKNLDITSSARPRLAGFRRGRVRCAGVRVSAAALVPARPAPSPAARASPSPVPLPGARARLLACSVLRSWGRGLVAPPPALRGGRWSRSRPRAPAATARRVGADKLRDSLLHTRGYIAAARATRVAPPPLHRRCTAWCRSPPTMPARWRASSPPPAYHAAAVRASARSERYAPAAGTSDASRKDSCIRP